MWLSALLRGELGRSVHRDGGLLCIYGVVLGSLETFKSPSRAKKEERKARPVFRLAPSSNGSSCLQAENVAFSRIVRGKAGEAGATTRRICRSQRIL